MLCQRPSIKNVLSKREGVPVIEFCADFQDLQLYWLEIATLLNKPYENEVTSREQNLYLRYCQPLELLIYFGKVVRSFNTGNSEFVGQRASKLLAVKFGGFKKKCAARPHPHSNHSAHIRERLGSNHFQSLLTGNFAALRPIDPKF